MYVKNALQQRGHGDTGTKVPQALNYNNDNICDRKKDGMNFDGGSICPWHHQEQKQIR